MIKIFMKTTSERCEKWRKNILKKIWKIKINSNFLRRTTTKNDIFRNAPFHYQISLERQIFRKCREFCALQDGPDDVIQTNVIPMLFWALFRVVAKIWNVHQYFSSFSQLRYRYLTLYNSSISEKILDRANYFEAM